MKFTARASVGNANGVFDAAYDFGTEIEAELTGTPQEIGNEIARFLSNLTPEDCKEMQYDTPRFFVELIIEQAGKLAETS